MVYRSVSTWNNGSYKSAVAPFLYPTIYIKLGESFSMVAQQTVINFNTCNSLELLFAAIVRVYMTNACNAATYGVSPSAMCTRSRHYCGICTLSTKTFAKHSICFMSNQVFYGNKTRLPLRQRKEANTIIALDINFISLQVIRM